MDPETGLIMFIVGGAGAVISFATFKAAQQIGPQIKPSDLLPMPPPHPPLPRFLYKPELLSELRRK